MGLLRPAMVVVERERKKGEEEQERKTMER
jgi:hypothetical protein